PMTALTIDAFRKVARKYRIAAGSLVDGGNLRKAVMAKQAFVGDEPSRTRMFRVRTGRHPPTALSFRIPTERQFDQGSARSAVQVRSGMVAGTHDVIDLQLFYVGFLTGKADLPAPLII